MADQRADNWSENGQITRLINWANNQMNNWKNNWMNGKPNFGKANV